MTGWRLAAVILLLGVTAGTADDAPPVVGALAEDAAALDRQDLLLFAPQRPLVVRLHITMDLKPYVRLWQDRIERAFAEVDTDGDGQITPGEAARLAATLCQATGSAPVDQPSATPTVPVTLPEMIVHCRKHGPALVVREEPGVSGTAIFAILDTDRDRRLSLNELQGAGEILRRRDFNDDEVVTADELLEDPRARANFATTGAQSSSAAVVLALERDTPREVLTAALAEHYDRNRDGRLTVARPDPEINLEPALVAQLAGDAAAPLSIVALADYCRHHIDLELGLALGAGSSGSAGQVAEDKGADFKIHRRLSRDLKIEGRGVEIDLRRNNRNPARNAEQDYDFANYDGDGNGYLDETESKQSPPLAGAFAAADSNSDGKLFKPEFAAYIRRQAEAAAARLVLKVVDRGQDLFNLLDALPDNQLSVREILAAPQLLATRDRDGDGYLSGDEIALRLDLELLRASAEMADRATAGGVRMAMPGPKSGEQPAGPAWFVAMDHNQDGDLSNREFLGSLQAFALMDANHDGLVDASEASAATK